MNKIEKVIDDSSIKSFYDRIENIKREAGKVIEAKEKEIIEERLLSDKMHNFLCDFSRIGISIKKEDFKDTEKLIAFISEELKSFEDPERKKYGFFLFKKLLKFFNDTKKEVKANLLGKRNKFKKEVANSVIEEKSKRNLEPYCNDLTSFARLIQINLIEEPCLCLYFQQNTVFYSTNRNTEIDFNMPIFKFLRKKDYQGFLNEGFIKIFEILTKCSEEVEEIFILEKEKLYFSDPQSIKKIFLLKSIKENRDYLTIDEISNFCLVIIESNRIGKINSADHFKKTSYFFSKAAINSYDLLRVYQLFSNCQIEAFEAFCGREKSWKIEKLDNNLLSLLQKLEIKKGRFFTENSIISGREMHVHCECKMLENICWEYDENLSLNLFSALRNAIHKKNFTISKFCCRFCYLLFDCLAKVCGNGSNLNLVGNSGVIFPNWISPSFPENQNLDKLQALVKEELVEITEKVIAKQKEKFGMFAEGYRERFDMNLENSLVVKEDSDSFLMSLS